MVKKRYYFLSAVMVVLALLMAFMPEKQNLRERSPEQLLAELNYDNRFWTTDRVAEMIIQQDPLLLLVDVRSPEEFAAYHLPGALNIPLAEITSPDWADTFADGVHEVVFYSNGTIYASQAWMLLRRQNYNNLYVMRGGLNTWVETILRPTPPRESDPEALHRLYAFRKGASAFFGTGGAAPSDAPVLSAPAPVKKAGAKPAGGGGGGC